MVENVGWLLFIRSGSSRYPRKCYSSIIGKNSFQWISERALAAQINPQDLILCTSVDPANQRLIDQATLLGHRYALGPEEYPIKRILDNIHLFSSYKYLVRICGDSPFYPFAFVQRIVSRFDKLNPLAITNTRNRCMPSGYSIEIYERRSLFDYLAGNEDIQREEHMSTLLTHSFYLESNIVDIKVLNDLSFFSSARYTLDFEDDIEHLEREILENRVTMYDRILQAIEFA